MYTLGFAFLLVLRTYDMVGVPSREIAAAERTVSAVMARAGIDVSWIACRGASAGTHRPACDQTRQPSELIVRLVAVPRQATNLALADAYIDTEAASGWFATIYVERVRSLAAASGVDPGTLMGRAMAHEVGHLLLGTSAHSATGLMRASWSAPMLRRQGAWAWVFSDEETDRLRSKVSQRVAPAPVVRADLIEPLPPSQPCGKMRGLVCAGPIVEPRP
jgi:hypothetical protein